MEKKESLSDIEKENEFIKTLFNSTKFEEFTSEERTKKETRRVSNNSWKTHSY